MTTNAMLSREEMIKIIKSHNNENPDCPAWACFSSYYKYSFTFRGDLMDLRDPKNPVPLRVFLTWGGDHDDIYRHSVDRDSKVDLLEVFEDPDFYNHSSVGVYEYDPDADSLGSQIFSYFEL